MIAKLENYYIGHISMDIKKGFLYLNRHLNWNLQDYCPQNDF